MSATKFPKLDKTVEKFGNIRHPSSGREESEFRIHGLDQNIRQEKLIEPKSVIENRSMIPVTEDNADFYFVFDKSNDYKKKI
uniref:Uncharacterized protein n=1 Tax=Romanomermis culicivorax TaxID=13658 RepID=A0A915JV14_ROMCU